MMLWHSMSSRGRRRTGAALVALIASGFAVTLSAAPPLPDKPSRPPVKGCAWEKFADPAMGLSAWVQRCDFGHRRIDFVAAGRSLAVRYSDGGGKPDPVIDVIDLLPDETAEDGIKRIFAARSGPGVAAKCVMAQYRGVKAPKAVRRYTFVPDDAYAKALKAKANPNEVPDPPCGAWGTAPDGIQYFEVPPGGGRAVLFVRVGQDEPLFDEKALSLPGPSAASR